MKSEVTGKVKSTDVAPGESPKAVVLIAFRGLDYLTLKATNLKLGA